MANKTETLFQGGRDPRGRPHVRYGLPGRMFPLHPRPYQSFEWGNRSTRAYALAAAVLRAELHVADPPPALVRAFRDRMVCHWMPHGWAISGRVVRLTVAQIEKEMRREVKP